MSDLDALENDLTVDNVRRVLVSAGIDGVYRAWPKAERTLLDVLIMRADGDE